MHHQGLVLTAPFRAIEMVWCAASTVALGVVTVSTIAFSPNLSRHRLGQMQVNFATPARPDLAAVALAKQELLLTLAVTDRGFSSSASRLSAVRQAINRLIDVACSANRTIMDIDGNWTLAWTDAPDILTLSGGPLAIVGRIGQEISTETQTITNACLCC